MQQPHEKITPEEAYRAWRVEVFGHEDETPLDERIESFVGIGLDKIIYEVEHYEQKYLALKADQEYLEHARKRILAEESEKLRDEMEKDGVKTTEAKLENLARCTDAYKNWLDSKRKVDRALSHVAPKYHARRSLQEMIRMKVAFLRTELSNLE